MCEWIIPWWGSNLFVDLQVHDGEQHDRDQAQDEQLAPVAVHSDVVGVLHLDKFWILHLLCFK